MLTLTFNETPNSHATFPIFGYMHKSCGMNSAYILMEATLQLISLMICLIYKLFWNQNIQQANVRWCRIEIGISHHSLDGVG